MLGITNQKCTTLLLYTISSGIITEHLKINQHTSSEIHNKKVKRERNCSHLHMPNITRTFASLHDMQENLNASQQQAAYQALWVKNKRNIHAFKSHPMTSQQRSSKRSMSVYKCNSAINEQSGIVLNSDRHNCWSPALGSKSAIESQKDTTKTKTN